MVFYQNELYEYNCLNFSDECVVKKCFSCVLLGSQRHLHPGSKGVTLDLGQSHSDGLLRRLGLSLLVTSVFGFLALALAFLVYLLFFYLVILDDFNFFAIFNKFYTTALVGLIIIPIEVVLHLFRRVSLVQSAFILFLLAFALDTLVSTVSFYRSINLFFAYLSDAIGVERFSLMLLAHEVLASILAILSGILFLVICKPVLFKLKLVDP